MTPALFQPHVRFNPRPREGATVLLGNPRQRLAVSIRAPVRGRRRARSAPLSGPQVSIRAPVRGRRRVVLAEHGAFIVSIRAPVRGRHMTRPAGFLAAPVSIRAPVRGRRAAFFLFDYVCMFQSAPP